MIVQSNNSGTGCKDVESLENLVESMSKGAGGLDTKDNK
jgi:hypothetical protein